MNEDLDVLGWHSRGYLPHFNGGTITQFVTFRLCDSVPKGIIERWEKEIRLTEPAKHKLELRKRIENYIDQGYGSLWLADERVASVVQKALLHFDGKRYFVHAWVIMPNHIHVLLTPTQGVKLGDIIRGWKSFSSCKANQILGRKGAFWQVDYFDRFIRNADHFEYAKYYIENNPVKARLCSDITDWKFSSASSERERSRSQEYIVFEDVCSEEISRECSPSSTFQAGLRRVD